MRRKIIIGVVIAFVLCILGVCGRVYQHDFDAAVRVGKIGKDWPHAVLPAFADPNESLPALQALKDYCEAHERIDSWSPQEIEEAHALVTNAVARLPGLALGQTPDERFKRLPYGVIDVSKFYMNAMRAALKAGDREAFKQCLGEYQVACDAFPASVFLIDLTLESVHLIARLEMLANLGAFPDTPLDELEAALASLPSDNAIVGQIINVMGNEYHHAVVPSIDTYPDYFPFSDNQKVYSYLPKLFVYARPASLAAYLRGMAITREALPLPAAQRTGPNNPDAFLHADYVPAHWYDRSLIGGSIAELMMPCFFNFADGMRDRVNLFRLGLAGQIFYRRHQRMPASLDELVSDRLLPMIPLRYSEGGPFALVQRNGEAQIALTRETTSLFFRLIPPNPAAGTLLADDSDK